MLHIIPVLTLTRVSPSCVKVALANSESGSSLLHRSKTQSTTEDVMRDFIGAFGLGGRSEGCCADSQVGGMKGGTAVTAENEDEDEDDDWCNCCDCCDSVSSSSFPSSNTICLTRRLRFSRLVFCDIENSFIRFHSSTRLYLSVCACLAKSVRPSSRLTVHPLSLSLPLYLRYLIGVPSSLLSQPGPDWELAKNSRASRLAVRAKYFSRPSSSKKLGREDVLLYA